MRFINPYPWGHPPRNEDLEAALADAVRAELVGPAGRLLAVIEGADLQDLPRALRIREDAPSFDERYHAPYGLVLEGTGGPIGRIDLVPEGGAVYWRGLDWKQWNGWAALADPQLLLEGLAARGVGGPLEDVARWSRDQGAEEAWKKAIPQNLRGPWSAAKESLLDAERVMRAAEHIREASASMRKAKGLLEWYGAGSGPFARRPDYELLPRVVLDQQFGYQDLPRALAPPRSERALAGAGRWILQDGPLPPVMRRTLDPLDAATREAMIDAVRRLASEEDAERLRGELFPAPFAPPEHTALVGLSETARLSRAVADEEGLYAIDGFEIVRLTGGQRIPITRLLGGQIHGARLAVRGGRLLCTISGSVREFSARGQLVATHPSATPAQIQAARAVIATWAPGDPALGEPLGPTVEEIEAYEAFAHLGLPPPASARAAGHLWIDRSAPALIRGSAAPEVERIPLPGAPVLHAFTEAHIVLALDIGGALQIAWLGMRPEEGHAALCPSPPLTITPERARFLRAAGEAAFLGVDSAGGQAALRIVTGAPR